MEKFGGKRKRWGRLFRVSSVLLIAAFVVSGVSLWMRPKEVRQVTGTVVSYKRTDSKTGGTPLLVVKLNSDQRIFARIGNDVPVHIGARVLLTETETWPFGFHRYEFMGYGGAVAPSRDQAGP